MVPTTECINIPSQLCDDVVEELCEDKCTPVWWCKVEEICIIVFMKYKIIKLNQMILIPFARCAPTMWRSFPGA